MVNPYSGALIDSVANCGAEETDLAIGEVIFDIGRPGDLVGDVNDDGGDFGVILSLIVGMIMILVIRIHVCRRWMLSRVGKRQRAKSELPSFERLEISSWRTRLP